MVEQQWTLRRAGTAKAPALVTLAFLAASMSPARATPVTAAYFEVAVGGTNTEYTEPGTYSSGGMKVTTAGSPAAVTVSGSGSSARGYERYYFRINGPQNEIVSFTVTGNLAVHSAAPDTSQANAVASIKVPTPFYVAEYQLDYGRGGTNYGSVTGASPVLSNRTYTNSDTAIILDTFLNLGDDGSGYAFADPVVSLDPALDPSLYTLSFSDGFSNGSAVQDVDPGATDVPEPASLALLLGGGLAACAVRSRAPARPA